MTLERITSRGRAPLKQARAPGDGPLDQAGRQVPFVRFEFPHDAKLAERLPKTFFSGHFDAHCPAWRMDDPALATDAFDEDVGFARLHYVMGVTDETGARLKSGAAHETATASLARPRSPTPAMADVTKHYHPVREYPYDPTTALERHLVPPSELERLQDDPVFARFKSKAILEESLNLEAFARHCMQLAPRCAHDFKPMCYLLQALLGHLLNREMSFWSEEVRELRNDLLRMRTLLDDAAQEHRIARASALLQKWRGKAKLSSARNNDAAAAMESHEHHILELTDKLTAEIDALKERCAKAEAKSGTQAALHKELKETKREKAKLEKELALAGKKAASEQKTLKTLCSQKDKTISELRRKVAELTETSDVTARMAAMAAEIEELKRRIEEGGGAAVENDDYEAFAKNLLAAEDTPEGRAERAKRFTNLSPHEAARVMQAMGDWSVAGEMLRRCTVDFTSDALTCGVLDPEDVGEALSNLSDMDGMVLFAMFRKMSHEAVAGVMRTVHPAIAGGWLANAADQAKSRMAVGGAVGVDALHDIVHTLGEQDVVAVLDAQRPEIVARLCEKMYYADELLDAVDALQGCSGATRTRRSRRDGRRGVGRLARGDEQGRVRGGGGDVRRERGGGRGGGAAAAAGVPQGGDGRGYSGRGANAGTNDDAAGVVGVLRVRGPQEVVSHVGGGELQDHLAHQTPRDAHHHPSHEASRRSPDARGRGAPRAHRRVRRGLVQQLVRFSKRGAEEVGGVRVLAAVRVREEKGQAHVSVRANVRTLPPDAERHVRTPVGVHGDHRGVYVRTG